MRLSHSFTGAEQKHRGKVLRDQRKGAVAKLVALVVGATMVLAACGTPAESQPETTARSRVLTDAGPAWAPNYELLNSLLSEQANVARTTVIADLGVFAGPTWRPNYGKLAEFLGDHGVFSGPTWEPNQALLEEIMDRDETVNTVRDIEPIGQPNYGGLETIPDNGSGTEAGPR